MSEIDWTNKISGRPWRGFLTNKTAAGIAKAITYVLSGKSFCVSLCYNHKTEFPKIEVSSNRHLVGKEAVKWSANDKIGCVQFVDNDNCYIFQSSYDGDPCYQGDPFEGKILSLNCPYFKFDREGFSVYELVYEYHLRQHRFHVEGDEKFDPFSYEHLNSGVLVDMIKDTEENLAEMKRLLISRNM
jgi:hypothetical protein